MGVHPALLPSYYVYQYATSFTASTALSEQVLAGDRAATQRTCSSSRPAGRTTRSTLLKQAGVDMTTREPLDLTMKKMNRVMDEMEQLLAKRK